MHRRHSLLVKILIVNLLFISGCSLFVDSAIDDKYRKVMGLPSSQEEFNNEEKRNQNYIFADTAKKNEMIENKKQSEYVNTKKKLDENKFNNISSERIVNITYDYSNVSKCKFIKGNNFNSDKSFKEFPSLKNELIKTFKDNVLNLDYILITFQNDFNINLNAYDCSN